MCKIEGKAKCFKCCLTVLGKTQYLLCPPPILAKEKWNYNVFGQKPT